MNKIRKIYYDEEDENKESTENQLFNIKLFYYKVLDEQWRPQTREFPSLTLVNTYLYLYGGRGNEIFNQLCVLDFQTWQWTNIQNIPQLSEGRYGHTANTFIN
ncbi:kelch motif family protein, putative [Ichthyophthirius multifiliis]|uniref:Kelch motif family protein, putative n=1 Tax=Ichthyophthirius multifiliis TaxID=5932 RepID=G0QS96_ICHMU|nr:kelch motif family protein, putative [Ichthyophthirius multifiliis]EGR31894.1 kelch motif family protein, putative [Ichthyophthirius multifiliis]|eukprot:XP_004035380.1 kelch motif family protein, putative [Ichthyophthirius multifiliis]